MLKWKGAFRLSYDRIEDDESKSTIPSPVWQISLKDKRLRDSRALPWAISSVLTLVLLWLMFEKHQIVRGEQLWGSYENGFVTDISMTNPSFANPYQFYSPAAAASARLRHVRFHSSFWVDDDDMWHMTTNSSEPRYVGPPSPEVDQAWEDILYRKFCV